MDADKALITVFTPTYNRRNCISKCYESLCKQTSYNFIWLVIDDGSNDDTQDLILKWQSEQDSFQIRYFWKENGGLHTGYNKGIELADTELFVCIDSDDWMPQDAIEKIEKIWSKVKNSNYVGIMGIDRFENGECVGDTFPDSIHEMFLYEKLTRYKLAGDKKMVHRLDLLKKIAPMPSFEGEKNFNPSYMMYQLDQFGKLYVTNECFCIVEYQSDGMSSNIYKQYLNSPRSFAETRKLYLNFPDTSLFFKFKHSVHLVSSYIIAGDFWSSILESPCRVITLLSVPFGFVLSVFIRHKARNKTG